MTSPGSASGSPHAPGDGPQEHRQPIAIVGMGCRFPGGASSPRAFWDLLCNGVDAIGDIPSDRWDIRRFYDPDPEKPGKTYARQGGFLRDKIDEFDPLFFGISPREANTIDPQQRLLMEVTWEALEDAGLRAEDLAGSDTGVFIGAFALDMKMLQSSPFNRDFLYAASATGASMTLLSNRLSYVFDWHGPSLSLDTACSSSLVATHYACQSLWSGECSLAVAGGANVMLRPEYFLVMCKGQYLSPEARCMAFDARANGYVRGEGAGVVLLKPLAAALRDRDPIYALIRATGVNQDGQTPGISFPNQAAQERLIAQVYAQAGVAPHAVQYVEAHGTGTKAGDPVEATALHQVLSRGRELHHTCLVGSVKTNIGHLEAAAGIAGLMKAALCLKHRAIPPSLHFVTPNPDIPFDDMCLRVPTQLEPWPAYGETAYAGVNSFGYGGTNAHVLLGEPPSPAVPARVEPVAPERPCLIPVSARSEPALKDVARQYATFLAGAGQQVALPDLAYSLSLRRSHHHYRAALVVASRDELQETLQALAHGVAAPRLTTHQARSGAAPPCVFVYTGMGPQWWAMGRQLLDQEPVFRERIEQCDAIFARYAPWSLLEVFTAPRDTSRIAETQVAQPANFALQIALTALWESWGITPQAVVGHSVGEVAAAYVAGALSLEDALWVSYQRSRLQQTQAGKGTMLAVGLAEPQAQELLQPFAHDVSIAAVNSFSSVTLAGTHRALQAIAARLAEQEVFHRFLQVEVAYHSTQMDPVETELLDVLSTITAHEARLPLYSSVTGKRLSGNAWSAPYWWRNVREPVRFAEAMQALLHDDYRLFLEVGPHPVLAHAMQEAFAHANVKGETIASLYRDTPELPRMLEALGTLYSLGWSVNWPALLPTETSFVALPTYPWQKASYWHESRRSRQDRLGHPGHVFTHNDLHLPWPAWAVELNDAFFPYLKDHCIDNASVFPGAAYVEAGLAVHKALVPQESYSLADLVFHKLLVVDAKEVRMLHVQYDPHTKGYAVYSRSTHEDAVWELHATGRLVPGAGAPVLRVDRQQLQEACPEAISAEGFYTTLKRSGFQYGPTCQTLRQIWIGPNQALARLEVHPTLADDLRASIVHPTILDASFQLCPLMVDLQTAQPWVPVAIEHIHVYASPSQASWVHYQVSARTPEGIRGNLSLFDDDGTVLVELKGVYCRELATTPHHEPITSWGYNLQWQRAAARPELPSEIPDGHWLIVSQPDRLQELLCAHLEARNMPYTWVSCGEVYARLSPTHYQVRATAVRQDLQQLGADVQRASVRTVLYLAHPQEYFSFAATTQQCTLLTALVQEMTQWPEADTLSLGIVTRGCQVISSEDHGANITSAPLWGVGRVIRQEYPHLPCTLVDIEPDCDAHIPILVEHFLQRPDEPELALRAHDVFVPRLQHATLSAEEPAEVAQTLSTISPVALEVTAPGRFDSLIYRASARRAPGPGEVEIEVYAAALNFKDVLKVMGTIAASVTQDTYFGDAFGMECAGRVVRVGAGVTSLHVGAEVVATTNQGSFRSYVTTAADYVIPKPAGVRLEEAPLFTVFLTAYYALVEVARLQQGETVLIHNAAGGVGLAAIQVAQWRGAEIFATAGSATKRAFLTSLGVKHVMDSRTLQFADDVHVLTAGQGVDVVVNALSGEALFKSFRLLAPYGRFVEIGKKDIAENSGLPMHTFNRNVSFTAIDLDRIFKDRPALARRLFHEVSDGFAQGYFQALPTTVFPAREAAPAFRYMAQSKHIGKVVLAMHNQEVPVYPATPSTALLRPDGTYLITGGTRGFGLEIAKWLSAKGVRHVVLISRSGVTSDEAKHAIMVMRSQGIQVLAGAVDVTDEQQVQDLFHEIEQTLPPLRGIFHGAMRLDDGLIAGLSQSRFELAMAPKVLGTWLLHTYSRQHPLDFFVMLSSMASLLGNVGQANYAAANAFLDHFAHYRRAQGLPALTINWGALADVGVVARHQSVEQLLRGAGIRSLPMAQALHALELCLAQASAQIGVFDIDWRLWKTMYPHLADTPLLQQLSTTQATTHESPEPDPATRLLQKLALLDPPARQDYVQALLAEALAHVLQLPVSHLSLEQNIAQLGLDSLMTVELKNALQGKYGVEISALGLLKGGSISQLAAQVVARLEPELARFDSLTALSEEALDMLLQDELSTISQETLHTLVNGV